MIINQVGKNVRGLFSETFCYILHSMKTIHHSADGKTHVMENDGKSNVVGQYAPLIALIGVSVAAAFALLLGHGGGMMAWMHYFMGAFLCQFALVKLFNLSGFANGFAKYDLLGSKSRTYGLIYPFLELTLGLMYLSFFVPVITYIVTIFLLGFGALGVIKALHDGKDLKCACMGDILKVPLSHVTLGEDLGMAAMALIMLLSMAS